MLTNTDTCTTDWGYDGSLSSRRVNKTIVYRNKPTGDNELTSVVDDRNLRIGFFHWLLSVIISQSSPPTESHVRDIVTSNRMQLVKWERIVEELLVAKVIKSFVQVVNLLWNNFIQADVDAERTNFNFVTSVTTLVTYPTSYVMDLLKFREKMLSYTILNTDITRVMHLIGRNVQETVSMRSAKKSVEGPCSHNVSTLYEIDDPTTQSAYKALMEDRKTDTRNSVVPPFAAIVYKAALLLGTVHAFTKDNPPPSDLPDNSRGPSLPSRKFQSAKNSMLWYLEQVINNDRLATVVAHTMCGQASRMIFTGFETWSGSELLFLCLC